MSGGDPTTAPRSVARVTAAVAAIGVGTLALAGTSPAPALAAVSGALLAVGLARFDGERPSTAAVAKGVALLSASAFVGAFVLVAGRAPGAADVTLSLAALLWLAALVGVGAGRGALSRSALDTGWLVAAAATVALGLLAPVVGLALVLSIVVVGWLSWNAAAPAVGTVLATYGVASLVVGAVLRSAPADAEARRSINRRVRERAAAAKRLGRQLLGVAGVVGVAGTVGGYRILGAAAPPLWNALALVTGSSLVRLVPVIAVVVAALAYVARRSSSWAWDDDGPDPTRVAILLSAVAAVAATGLATAAAALLVAVPGFAPALGAPGAANWSPVWGGLGVATVVPAAVLFGLRALAGASDRRTAVGPRVCAGALLAGSVVVALRGSGVVAPLVGVGAAAIVWDVGRIGATMGAELGDEATVERSALVRVGGSAAVGAIATVVAVVLAAGLRRLGRTVDRLVGGPVVLAIGVGVALVAALALYARGRASSPA